MWSVAIKFEIIDLYYKKFHTLHTYIHIYIYIYTHTYNNLHLNRTHTNKREYIFTLNVYSKEQLFALPQGLNLVTPNIATQIF